MMVTHRDVVGCASRPWFSADCQPGVAANVEQLITIDHAHPDAFVDGIGQIPNNPITAATLAAILHGGDNAPHLSAAGILTTWAASFSDTLASEEARLSFTPNWRTAALPSKTSGLSSSH